LSQEEKVIKLKHPIPVEKQAGGTVLTDTLTLGRFKAKHLRLLPKSFFQEEGSKELGLDEVIPLLAGVSGLKESEIDEIDAEDIRPVIQQTTDFFLKCLSLSQKTGKI
jgi:hypothetical protein